MHPTSLHRRYRAAGLLVWLVLLPTPAAFARVVRVEITRTEPFQDGRSFEGIGPYQRLRGQVHFAVDPKAAANAMIVDLQRAATTAQGEVEFAADLDILVPADRRRANGTLLYDVNNRGNRMAENFFNTAADHFLMRHGYIVVCSGWIAEVPPRDDLLRLDAPIATDGGQPIRGLIRCEMITDEPTDRLNVSGRGYLGSYRPTPRGLQEATLTWRLRAGDPRVAIPRRQWRLEVEPVQSGDHRWPLPMVHVVLPAGFQPGYLYELIYEAQDPVVQGLGLAGIRDLMSFLRHDGSQGNPLAVEGRSVVERTIGWGISQSGRCLRVLTYLGLNADEQGRRVFDGLIPHVAGGGLGFFNHRFASPSRFNAQHPQHDFPCDMFPFTYADQHDPLSGREDGILRRARRAGVVPKIMHTNTSAEYWHRSGSLAHTDPTGERDAPLPDEVRMYAFGGCQHGAADDLPAQPTVTAQVENPTDYRPLLRALLVAMDRWLRDGTAPPPSVYPRIADGTLVDWRAETAGWSPLPGVRYPEVIQQPELFDFGPEFAGDGILEGRPPRSLGRYRVLVPAYDEDGNEQGVLKLPSIAVPVATYTGWNLRHRRVGAESELYMLKGSYLPLPTTAEDRQRLGDPRRALLERYRDFDDYHRRYMAAAKDLVAQGYVLAEDLPLLESRADARRKWFEPAGR